MKKITAALFIFLLIMVPAAFGADGEKLYLEKCSYCHVTIKQNVHAPELTGKTAEYLLKQVTDIAEGKRLRDYSHIMKAYMSGELTFDYKGKPMIPPNPEELKLIVEYLAKQK
ncbi:MAG: c-type cytochrome [Deltaproteobacteria bacterium]|nr:c-type cytochrome [Deltaproteobacteria bacterium]